MKLWNYVGADGFVCYYDVPLLRGYEIGRERGHQKWVTQGNGEDDKVHLCVLLIYFIKVS
jgi:hypothetical protein